MPEKNILIVDDIPEYIENLKIYIEDFFNRIFVAHNSKIAKNLIDKYNFDVAIIDIRLKDDEEENKEGIELIKIIRSKNKDCIIIAMSAYREFDYAMEALKAGANFFIKKPIMPQKILELLKNK